MEPRSPHLGPVRPRASFGAKNGGPKNMISWRDWFPTSFPRIFYEGSGLYGTQEPFGCTNFPLKPPREGFCKDFLQIRKPLGAPLGPLVGCLLPFVGLPMALVVTKKGRARFERFPPGTQIGPNSEAALLGCACPLGDSAPRRKASK